MVVQGHDSTLPVTVSEMVYHTRMVARGLKGASLLVSDMPFLSYQPSIETAIREAGRLIKEGGAQAVKLEGGKDFVPTVRALVSAMIPVNGPSRASAPRRSTPMRGFRLQGRESAEGEAILADARALSQAGVFALVVEGIPGELAKRIASEVPVPVIGIGAGPHTDGQVLVIHDLMGWTPAERLPKFVRPFSRGGEEAVRALSEFRRMVEAGQFHKTEGHDTKEGPDAPFRSQ
ncbi:MAG: 3-methyl-2-oxobutanoate hydroxymethyltransferase [Leptospirillum sp. Group IV 'UBA BS']|nr:MAG: 3-methyl-2-oxobutanoate hydroxymethyltransferase [Leptospirillum sp. Group IV 'UBA BS']